MMPIIFSPNETAEEPIKCFLFSPINVSENAQNSPGSPQQSNLITAKPTMEFLS